MKRRTFLGYGVSGWLASHSPAGSAPALLPYLAQRPKITHGVQAGDLLGDRAILWSRVDRPARMQVEISTRESMANARSIRGPAALEPTDLTARLDLTDLPPDQRIFYRVTFEDLDNPRNVSEPVTGSLRTPPRQRRDLSFVWGGDVCGQGWGIDPAFGGLQTFESMRRVEPDLFIHSGDTIYADNPIAASVPLEDGRIWRNLTSREKEKVAESLDEFRGNYRYNLQDEPLRNFNASVPILTQWDDHEVRNNWYPGQQLEDDPRYTVKSMDLLAARARRAFLDYHPLRFDPLDPERIFRAFPYGPSLEIFMLDERSYRGPNTQNRQPVRSAETQFLGSAQGDWLKERLRQSRATWKVIASDMPIGLIVGDSGGRFEAVANGDGPALGRELEIAEILHFIHRNRIENVVWITADVHYAAAHHYDPSRAQFTNFTPFWEFVAGPLHAGTFGPGKLDNTFGPEAKFVSIPPGMKGNRPPSDGHQFFGRVRIDGRTEVMTVNLHNREGRSLYQIDLPPTRRR
jgi:alkaline phosphatase D